MLSEGLVLIAMMMCFFIGVSVVAFKGGKDNNGLVSHWKESYSVSQNQNKIQKILKTNKALIYKVESHFKRLSETSGTDLRSLQDDHLKLFDETESNLKQMINLMEQTAVANEPDFLRLKEVAIQMSDQRKLLIENGAKIMDHFDEQMVLRSKLEEDAVMNAIKTAEIKKLNERVTSRVINEQQRLIKERQQDQMRKLDDIRY